MDVGQETASTRRASSAGAAPSRLKVRSLVGAAALPTTVRSCPAERLPHPHSLQTRLWSHSLCARAAPSVGLQHRRRTIARLVSPTAQPACRAARRRILSRTASARVEVARQTLLLHVAQGVPASRIPGEAVPRCLAQFHWRGPCGFRERAADCRALLHSPLYGIRPYRCPTARAGYELFEVAKNISDPPAEHLHLARRGAARWRHLEFQADPLCASRAVDEYSTA